MVVLPSPCRDHTVLCVGGWGKHPLILTLTKDQLDRVEQKKQLIEEFRAKIETDTESYEESAAKLALYTERKEAEAGEYRGACQHIEGDLAAMTKQASSGPREVANIPAPHGHQVLTMLLHL